MNLRPSGYEPDELPDCSTPQQQVANITELHEKLQGTKQNNQKILLSIAGGTAEKNIPRLYFEREMFELFIEL